MIEIIKEPLRILCHHCEEVFIRGEQEHINDLLAGNEILCDECKLFLKGTKRMEVAHVEK